MKDTTVTINGEIKQCVEVSVVSSVERWNRIKLEDGAVVLFRHTPLQVVRLKNESSETGEPIYIITTQPLMRILDNPKDWNSAVEEWKLSIVPIEEDEDNP